MQYSIKKIFNYIRIGDIGHFFLCLLIAPWALVAKIFIRNFWLVCEDKNEARDNGYHFYKWVRNNKPTQKIAYAINKKSPDYQRIKDLGKIISYGTIEHWFWYIVADKNISSQKGGKPNPAVCYFFEVILKFRKNNRIFLQHGVIKDRLDWLFYKNTNMRMFVTSAVPEQEYIEQVFGYPNGYVKMLGLPRFDALHDFKRDENLILVMPTWRNWLGRVAKDNQNLDFCATLYYQKWNEFLNNGKLDALLKKYNKKLLFYPHRNMQKFLNNFRTNSQHIIIADWKNYNIQDVLKAAALMVTDYSSVFFDFAYMRKPIIFYQFDEKEFREKQYAEGYFDYHATTLGEWCEDLDKLLYLLEQQLEKGLPLIPEEDVQMFFPLRDTKNSERIYDAIKNEL